ncbi:MAG: NAD(P)-binding domain-containing protein [Eggerthellaceae bacterium]
MSESFVFIGNSEGCVPLATSLMQAGYRNAESLEEADVLFVYCIGQSIHEDTFFEEEGILAVAGEGRLIIDLSPATPNLAKEIFAMSILSGIDYVEAPVSLVDIADEHGYAYAGNVVFRVAGETDPCDKAQAILERISQQVIRCGGAGCAQMAKCAESVCLGAKVAGIAEAQMLVNAMNSMPDKPQASIAQAPYGLVADGMDAFSEAVFQGAFKAASGYTLETFLAEITAAQLAAEDLNLPLPMSQSVQCIADLVARAGGAGLSAAAVALVYAETETALDYGVDWIRLDTGSNGLDDEDECECGGHDHACGCGHHDDEEEPWEEGGEAGGLGFDDGFHLDFDGVDAFDAMSFGESPYPEDPANPFRGYGNDWSSN